MIAVLQIIRDILWLLKLLLIVHIILGWLISFGVLNMSNRFVQILYQFTSTLCEPMLAPFRRVIPSVNGIDLSPILLFLLITFVDYLILYSLIPAVMR